MLIYKSDVPQLNRRTPELCLLLVDLTVAGPAIITDPPEEADQEDLLWRQDQQHCLFDVGLVMKTWWPPQKSLRVNLHQHLCTLNQFVLLWGTQLLNSRLSAEKSWTGKEQREQREQLLPFFPADPLANAIPELCYREQIALYSWQSGAFAAFLCRRPLLQWLRRLTGNTTSNLWRRSDQQKKFKEFDSI